MAIDEELMEEIDDAITDEGIFKVKKILPHGDSIVAYATQKNNGSEVVIKFPNKRGKKEIENTYNIKKCLDDLTHIVKIIGDGPREYSGEFAIVMEKGTTLENILGKKRKNPDLDFDPLKMIYESSLGIRELHRKSFKHRDVKPSNLIHYEDVGWTVSDFGSSSTSDFTDSHKSIANYAPFEIANIPPSESDGLVQTDSDIFAIGACLFRSLHSKDKTLFEIFKEVKKGDDNGVAYNFEFAQQEIDKLEANDKTKYFLKRLMGEKAPDIIQKGKSAKNYRYRNIDFFLEEYEGRAVFEETAESNETYKAFVDTCNMFSKKLSELEKYRSGKWGLVDLDRVDEIKSLQIKLEELANDPSVQTSPYRNSEFSDVISVYMDIGEKEYSYLDDKMKVVKEEFSSVSDSEFVNSFAIPFSNYIFCWGAPVIRDNTKRLKGEKKRYSLDEIKAKQTHYHKEGYFITEKK